MQDRNNRIIYGSVFTDLIRPPVSVAVNSVAMGAGGLGFEIQAGQIDTVSPSLRRFFVAVLPKQ